MRSFVSLELAFPPTREVNSAVKPFPFGIGGDSLSLQSSGIAQSGVRGMTDDGSVAGDGVLEPKERLGQRGGGSDGFDDGLSGCVGPRK